MAIIPQPPMTPAKEKPVRSPRPSPPGQAVQKRARSKSLNYANVPVDDELPTLKLTFGESSGKEEPSDLMDDFDAPFEPQTPTRNLQRTSKPKVSKRKLSVPRTNRDDHANPLASFIHLTPVQHRTPKTTPLFQIPKPGVGLPSPANIPSSDSEDSYSYSSSLIDSGPNGDNSLVCILFRLY